MYPGAFPWPDHGHGAASGREVQTVEPKMLPGMGWEDRRALRDKIKSLWAVFFTEHGESFSSMKGGWQRVNNLPMGKGRCLGGGESGCRTRHLI